MSKKAKALAAGKAGASQHRRAINAKIPGQLTLIVCEGTTTEVSYFKDMIRTLKIRTADVRVIHGKKSNPSAVVQSAIDYYEKERKFEKIYIVVDVDQHGKDLLKAQTNLESYIFSKRIKDGSKVIRPTAKMIISNPCIEVWFILHFELLQKTFEKNKNSKSINCKNYLRDNYIKNYAESIAGLYRILRDKEATAQRNIAKLKTHNKALAINEPDTDVHLLCQHLNAMRIH